MTIPLFHSVGITLAVILDLFLLVRPLVRRNLVHGLGLFDERRRAGLDRTREVVSLFAEWGVRGDDRAQVGSRLGEG